MKAYYFLSLLIAVLIFSCKNSTEPIENSVIEVAKFSKVEVTKDQLKLNGNEGNWYYKNQLFTGFLIHRNSEGILEQKVGFYKGKKEGIAKVWFSNGQLKVVSYYQKNKLEGSYKSWWINGVLASEAIYKNGKLEGVEKRWYNSGQLAKKMHYINGIEAGMQQAWLKNGKIYVNYEAKNGRIFGMRKANLCYQLEDEIVIMDERSEAAFGTNKK
ncbi:toxin-antitoxin system YwqK family antitoxin [Lutibacter sp. A64]|uniref:toxin-antitoxin system YwqK family antitoxin n=1 Tax=Lutibacter sp. A64 TaxID=2918526 RepID=UPI001F06DA8C|nr:toxin-antitoxin system YwqK family antitoxin [Lutibacter sp. A64]UMB54648.1 toxin-antitoxin system YwqK family antitoxin [Lutibacter sp. A64]